MYKYTAIALVSLAWCGCSHNVMEEVPIDPIVPEHGYIFFNTEVASRGELIEDETLEKDFSVLGYSYTGEWIAAKALATPDVFAPNHPQTITWESNKHSYIPLKEWVPKKKYAFFAYYPTSLNPSANTKEGNPYIDFTLPSRSNAAGHVDVMTAHIVDTDASSPNVSFTMKHRLTAIDVLARNLNDKYEGKDVYVNISKISIQFDNLLYDKVRIPLNSVDEPDLMYSFGFANNQTATFPIYENATPLKLAPNSNDSESVPLTSSAQNNTMIVIPQDRYIDVDQNSNGTIEESEKAIEHTLTGKFIIEYDYVDGNNSSLGLVTNPTVDKEISFRFPKDLKSGRRYYILLNFSRSAVTIAFVESDEWKDKEVEYEFE